MRSIRSHLSYANVVATLALLFAMSGGALAAKHYLINSTRQIDPKVLRKLKGHAGRAGPKGPAGSPGASGSQGATGAEGARGPAGQSALSPLPSGQSESGNYGVRTGNTSGANIDDVVTFPIALAAGIPESNVAYTKAGTPVPHCSGPGHADPAFLCIYSSLSEGVETPPNVFSPDGSAAKEKNLGRLGFEMEYRTTEADAFDAGTYTVTAG
ncbi:MAG TPA: hypothetical protein VLJ80_04300 [Solirubrobacteraceae bacterium]|nr:hypothetical protein [Solirubrobacteraceae bacterium]